MKAEEAGGCHRLVFEVGPGRTYGRWDLLNLSRNGGASAWTDARSDAHACTLFREPSRGPTLPDPTWGPKATHSPKVAYDY